jgi:hypothetical protein
VIRGPRALALPHVGFTSQAYLVAITVCELHWCSSPLLCRHVSTPLGVGIERVLKNLERGREL